MKDYSKAVVRDWIFQLIGQGVLAQSEGEYPVLKLNLASWKVMRGEQKVQLLQPVKRKKDEKVKASKADLTSWEGVERELFEALRKWRFDLAKESNKPPYVIFSDETLRQLARVRPSNNVTLRSIYGIGELKMRELGPLVLPIIKAYCEEHGLSMDNAIAPPVDPEPTAPRKITGSLATAFELFGERASIELVMEKTGRARTTVVEYLSEFIRQTKPPSIEAWVPREVYARVAAAVKEQGGTRLKPIFLALEEKVSYDEIRLVIAHLGRDSQ